MSITTTLESIRVDKWLHALGSVVIFAAVHYATGDARIAAGAAFAAHVAKKLGDVALKKLDPRTADGRADFVGDIAFGLAGVLLAWACLFTR
jgi:hypothetical protein